MMQPATAAARTAADERAAQLAAADRASRDAALTLALTLPGDTLLYLLLPLHAAAFGVGLPEVGVLLAANRLVRIFGYGMVTRGYERFGPRAACLVATLGAVGASLGYALLSGLWALLPARLLWGLSFAALNIATQALATAEGDGIGRRSGRSRAVISAGPMLGLLFGAVLAEFAGPRPVFLALAPVALLGLLPAARIPAGLGQPVRAAGPRFALPTRLDIWSFVQGLALDGVFVLGLSVLAAASLPKGAVLAAGCALSLRYAAEVVLSPPGGVAAERWGALRVLVLCSFGSAAGLAVIAAGVLWPGVLSIVLLRGLLQPLPAPVAAAANPGPARVPALARLATWRDLGAGAGPLLAGVLLPLAPAALYLGAAVALAAATVAVVAPRRRR